MRPIRRVGAAMLAGAWLVSSAAAADLDMRLRGRVQVDHDAYTGIFSRSGQAHTATYLRRADLSVAVQWRKQLRAVLGVQADSQRQLAVDSAYLQADIGQAPAAALKARLGRFDPDFGLEPSGSTSWTLGIERSALWDLAPEVIDGADAAGLQLSGSVPAWQGSVSVLARSGHRSGAVRLVWQPPQGQGRMVHLGLSAAAAQGWQGDGRIRTRLAVRGVSEHADGHRPVLAGAAGFERDRTVALEGAAVLGAWSLQAEWLRRTLGGSDAASARVATGHYLQLSWSPTGQARDYNADGARFGGLRRGRPDHTAWELVARRDQLAVTGGRSAAVRLLGVNAYPSRDWRLSANLVWARTGQRNEAGDARGRALSLRAQWLY